MVAGVAGEREASALPGPCNVCHHCHVRQVRPHTVSSRVIRYHLDHLYADPVAFGHRTEPSAVSCRVRSPRMGNAVISYGKRTPCASSKPPAPAISPPFGFAEPALIDGDAVERLPQP